MKLSNRPVFLAIAGGFAATLAAFVLATSNAQATRFEPNTPVRLVAGPSRGAGTMARVDGTRRGCVNEIPDRLRALWQLSVRSGVEVPPAVDQDGSVVVALTLAEVVQVSASGAEQWRTKTGIGTATTGPVILRDGTRLVLNALGEAWGIYPNGAVRFRIELGGLGRDARVGPLPLENGSVAIAAGPNMLVLEADGSIRAQARAEESLIGSLIEIPGGILGLSESGKVVQWMPPLAPKTVGTFHGSVRDGAVLAGAHSLLAVVDRRRLVALDLVNGTTETHASLSGMEGPPALAVNGVAFTTTQSGLLVGSTSVGEVLRVPLDPGAGSLVLSDAGVASTSYGRSGPALLVDRRARVLFARADGRVGVVKTSGQVSVLAAGCDDVSAIVPAPSNRFLLACRTGSVVMLGP